MVSVLALFQHELEAFGLLTQERLQELQTLGHLLERGRADKGEEIALLKHQHAVDMALLHALYKNRFHGPMAGVSPISEQIKVLQNSTLFDAEWYRENYPDIAGEDTDVIEHYVRVGAFEGRNPGPGFETMAYYLANPDIAAAGWPALVHYVMFGRAEGRPKA